VLRGVDACLPADPSLAPIVYRSCGTPAGPEDTRDLDEFGRERTLDCEDDCEETTTKDVEHEGDDPQPEERRDRGVAGAFDGRRGRVGEVLVEQLGPPGDEEDDAGRKRERARNCGDLTECGSTNDSTIPSATRPKKTVNPAMKLVETSSSDDRLPRRRVRRSLTVSSATRPR